MQVQIKQSPKGEVCLGCPFPPVVGVFQWAEPDHMKEMSSKIYVIFRDSL